jgi:nucleoside-diphosphate-sugar epimerase
VEGFRFCWSRVFYPYGPGEHPSRLCSSIIARLSRGEPVILKTPDSTKDYIFIEDLAGALLTVVEQRFAGCINLGTGTGVTVREIAQTISEMMDRRSLVQEANPPELDPVPYVVADGTRLRGLGWRPAHSLADGLKQLVQFL